MEVYRGLEALLVPKAPRISLELLDHCVEPFGTGIGRAGDHGGQDALEVLFDHPDDLLDRLESRPNRQALPAHPGFAGPGPGLVAPQALCVNLVPYTASLS